jgi:hypothetical protein
MAQRGREVRLRGLGSLAPSLLRRQALRRRQPPSGHGFNRQPEPYARKM